MNKHVYLFIGLSLIAVALTACAAGPNPLKDTADEEGNTAGFWMGLWHGIIAPVTFVVSLFSNSVTVFEVYNNGGWYTFGFLIGASMTLGGSGGAASRRRKKD
jgi:predicted phage tail protein